MLRNEAAKNFAKGACHRYWEKSPLTVGSWKSKARERSFAASVGQSDDT